MWVLAVCVDGKRVWDYLDNSAQPPPFYQCITITYTTQVICTIVCSLQTNTYKRISTGTVAKTILQVPCLTAQNQVITILRGCDHGLCLCGKLRIKHSQASGKHRGLSKGQFVSFNCSLSACLPNRIKLCRSFAFAKNYTVLHKNRVDVITIGHGLMQSNRVADYEETKMLSFSKRLSLQH